MPRYDHGGDVYQNRNVILDFSVNINPLGMPGEAKRALVHGMERFSCYPDPRCGALTRAIAKAHGVLPENILCGNGAADLLFRVSAYKRARRALTLAPTFSEYERPMVLFGGEMTEYPLEEEKNFALDEGFLSALTKDTDMVFLCNPNNPTGRLAQPEFIEKIAAAAKKIGALLVVDECFLPFSGGASMLPYLSEYPNMLILRAFTKLYAMAGLRLGYLLCADGGLLKTLGEYGAQWSVSVPAQLAGLASLEAEPEWTMRTRAFVDSERRYMEGELAGLGLRVFPSDANFLLIKSGLPLYQPLLKAGILVRDCANFTGLDARFIRIGIKTGKENEALLRAMGGILHG